MATTSKLTVFNDVLSELGIKYRLANVVTSNARLTALDGSFDHAVEYMLAQADWGFARRRTTLTGSSSSAFPPYTYVFTRPSDFLRVCWLKTNADDDVELDYAESAASIYMFVDSGLLEYVSDHADNYDPVNWPPHFTRAFTLYLALLVAPGLARAGDDVTEKLYGLFSTALELAQEFDARHLTNAQIPIDRHPVMRLALSFMGQELGATNQVRNHVGKLHFEMQRSWTHAVRYVLEQGAWNFASRRVRLTGGSEEIPGGEWDSIIEGYSVEPAEAEEDSSDVPISEFDYGYVLPSDFLHKIWLKADPADMIEADHQFLKDQVMTNVQPAIMEYVSNDSDAIDPDNWPATFTEAVAAYLAFLAVPELYAVDGGKRGVKTMFEAKEALNKLFQAKLGDAKRKDSIQQQRKRVPLGNFARARLGGSARNGIWRYR
jgi:hypothetical protein